MAVTADHIRIKLTKDLGAVHVVGLPNNTTSILCTAYSIKQ